MQCLQCGKAIPLFKRLGGSSEFCSDAHRKEYQREYSQLALGRLMQSHSSESQTVPAQAPTLLSFSAPAIDESPAARVESGAPALNAAPPTAKARPATIPYAPVPAAKANGTAKSQAPPMPVKKAVPLPAASQPAPHKAAASEPAIAKAAAVQKPAPAELQFALVTAPEFEHAFASLAPDRPRRQANILPLELPQSGAVTWESGVEIANSIARPTEKKLDLREVSRTTPRVALDLRIVPPESLETESHPLAIATALAELAEASLWAGPHRDFAGELASLSDFANEQFAKSEFEAPVLDGDPAPAAVAEVWRLEPQLAALNFEAPTSPTKSAVAVVEACEPPPQVESETSAPIATLTPAVRIPDRELNPLPVSTMWIAPGRVKPLPVFGPTPIGTGTIQIPPPNGLPLRPAMVLATAAPVPAVRTGAQKRKGSFLSLGSALSAEPALSAASDLGLPELAIQTPAGPSRMRKILAALGGVAVLGAGIFFFPGKQSDSGLKSPKTAHADGAQGGQWIANFAPDAKRQRRVSLLRSSMSLSAYRLDFESSIHIKALGWVYRARDARNFYVSKIEFQKPGQNPVYALVHYAVINGVEQPRVETPLHVSVPMGGLYKVRFEAVGNQFTTWVQGQRVDQWTDSRLSSGGAGLYGEGAEQSVLRGEFVVTPLTN